MKQYNDKHNPSRDIGKTIAETTARAFALQSREVIEIFDALQSTLLEQEFDEAEVIEIRRRIAEAKISVLAVRKGGQNELQQSWDDIESLGFSNSEREASMIFYRAQFLIRNRGEVGAINSLLERLDQIVDSGFKEGAPVADHFGKVCRSLRNELKAEKGVSGESGERGQSPLM